MNTTHALMALTAYLAIGTSHAQQREYIVYDDQSYPNDQLNVTATSPVMVKPAQCLGSGGYSIPRVTDGHCYITGAVNGFPMVFMVDTGVRFTTLSVKLACNAGIRAGRAASFDTTAGHEHGGITTANTVIVDPFTVEGTAIAILKRLSAPLLGMDVLNRFQIAYSGGSMILRGGRWRRQRHAREFGFLLAVVSTSSIPILARDLTVTLPCVWRERTTRVGSHHDPCLSLWPSIRS